MSRRTIMIVALAAVVTAGLAFTAGRVTSPEQRAATAAPPTPTTPTAQLEMRSVHPAVHGRGEVVYPAPTSVRLPAQGDGADVVTGVTVVKGRKVSPLDVLVEVVGHPVLAIECAFSGYRDVRIGDSGPDVRAVKASLSKAGKPVSTGPKITASDMSMLESIVQADGYALPRAASPGDAAPNGSSGSAGESGGPASSGGAAGNPTPYLPGGWWAGIATLPATVVSPGPVVGESLSESERRLTVSTGAPSLSFTPQYPIEGTVPRGSRVSFEPDTGKNPAWASQLIKDATGALTTAGEPAPMVLRTGEELGRALVGVVGKATLTPPGSDRVLTAPITALRVGKGGEVVVVLVDGQTRREVPVIPGDEANGWVEISADDDRLLAGATVELAS